MSRAGRGQPHGYRPLDRIGRRPRAGSSPRTGRSCSATPPSATEAANEAVRLLTTIGDSWGMVHAEAMLGAIAQAEQRFQRLREVPVGARRCRRDGSGPRPAALHLTTLGGSNNEPATTRGTIDTLNRAIDAAKVSGDRASRHRARAPGPDLRGTERRTPRERCSNRTDGGYGAPGGRRRSAQPMPPRRHTVGATTLTAPTRRPSATTPTAPTGWRRFSTRLAAPTTGRSRCSRRTRWPCWRPSRAGSTRRDNCSDRRRPDVSDPARHRRHRPDRRTPGARARRREPGRYGSYPAPGGVRQRHGTGVDIASTHDDGHVGQGARRGGAARHQPQLRPGTRRRPGRRRRDPRVPARRLDRGDGTLGIGQVHVAAPRRRPGTCRRGAGDAR